MEAMNPPNPMKPRTLYDKIWDDHLVHAAEDGTSLSTSTGIWCMR